MAASIHCNPAGVVPANWFVTELNVMFVRTITTSKPIAESVAKWIYILDIMYVYNWVTIGKVVHCSYGSPMPYAAISKENTIDNKNMCDIDYKSSAKLVCYIVLKYTSLHCWRTTTISQLLLERKAISEWKQHTTTTLHHCSWEQCKAKFPCYQ